MASPVRDYLNRSASVGTDLFYALLVALGAAVITAVLPLSWIPLVGTHLPGIMAGLVGGLFFYRARSNSPLNFGS
jgi:hypothetical protein